MKKLLIAILATLSITAMASEEGGGGWSGTNTNTNTNTSTNTNSSSASIGGSNLVSNYNTQRNPVASAIAPSVYNSVVCPIINQSSHAAQTIIFGASTTGTPTVNAICVAFNLNQADVVERMTCASDAAYKKANPNCK